MDYTLHQLRVFLKISETLSVTKAAEELHLTQPAVSIQLKNFQEQFDIPLTEVIGRQLYVTDFGKEVADAADTILSEVYAINYKTLAYKGRLAGRLKISAVSTGKYVMPYFLSEFVNENPGVELVMDVTNKTRVIESLHRNEVDFSLVSVMPEKLQLSSEMLMPNRLFLVGNPEWRSKVRIKGKGIFKRLPMIFREQGSGTRHVMEKFFDKNGIEVRRTMELTSNEAVKQAVLAGLGCSITPLIGIRNELSNGSLQIIPVKGLPISSNWQLVWLSQKRLSPIAEAYLEYIRKRKEDIITRRFQWTEDY